MLTIEILMSVFHWQQESINAAARSHGNATKTHRFLTVNRVYGGSEMETSSCHNLWLKEKNSQVDRWLKLILVTKKKMLQKQEGKSPKIKTKQG